MREILFKAKTLTGEWVEGYLVKAKWYVDEKEICAIIPIDVCFYPHCEISEWYNVDVNTLCQYTGLTDKNGNKIWENDIVKKHFYTDYDTYANSEEYTGIVKFMDCAWVIEFKRDNHICAIPIIESITYSHDIEYFEIIGNIFNNPELIGGGE